MSGCLGTRLWPRLHRNVFLLKTVTFHCVCTFRLHKNGDMLQELPTNIINYYYYNDIVIIASTDTYFFLHH